MAGVAARIREAGGIEQATPLAGSVADQAFVSLTHFMVNLTLANWLPPAQYGAFAIGFAVLAIALELQNSLHLLPMAVLGTTTYRSSQDQYLKRLWHLHWVGAAVCTALLLLAAAVSSGAVSNCLLALSSSLPLSLALHAARRICQIKDRQVLCAAGSFVYLAVTGVGLLVQRQWDLLSPANAIFALGAAAAAGSLFIGLVLASGRRKDAATPVEISKRAVVRAHLDMARWSLPSTLATAGMAQGMIFLAGAAQGTTGAASIRAAVTLVMPFGQFVTAMQSHFLPKLSRDFEHDERQWRRTGRMLTMWLAAGALAYAALVSIFHEQLYGLIYGWKYTETSELLALLALACVPATLVTAQQIVLMSRKQYRGVFQTAMTGAAVGLPAEAAGVLLLGLPGLISGSAAGYAAAAFRCAILSRRRS